MNHALLRLTTLLALLPCCMEFAIAQQAATVYNCEYGEFDNALSVGYSRLNHPPVYTDFKVDGSTVQARKKYVGRPEWVDFGYADGNTLQGIDAGSHGTFKNLRNETFDLDYMVKYSIDLRTGKAEIGAMIRGAPGGTWRGNMKATCLTDAQAAAIEARRAAARTPEEAQGFLLRILEDGTANFIIGNVMDQKFGALPKTNGTSTSYRKKMFGRWVEYRRSPTEYIVRLDISNFTATNSRGAQDVCTTSAGNIAVKQAVGLVSGTTFKFPTDSLTKEVTIGDDVKWIYTLHADPRPMFSGSYFIDWRKSTFARNASYDPNWIRFDISTGNRVPYASIVVANTLADDVESALRSLQSSCKGGA